MRNSHTFSLPPASRGGNQFSHIHDRTDPSPPSASGTSRFGHRSILRNLARGLTALRLMRPSANLSATMKANSND